MRAGILVGLVLMTHVGLAFAGGIAYRLPPDGTWAKYKIASGDEYILEEFHTQDGRRVFTKVDLPPAPKKEDLFLVRSVGRFDVAGVPHRWLELVNEPAVEGQEMPPVRVIVLKLLIPESAFGPGSDPFDYVRKMYMSDRRPDGETFVSEVKDADRLAYELERFRALFPVAPKGTPREERVERETPAGRFQGYRMEFDYGYEGKLFAGKKGKNTHKGRYRVVVSEAAPFGIVEVKGLKAEWFEDKGDGTGSVERGKGGRMELVEWGRDAKSGLPDLK
jgi:hypothetical protein